MAENDWVKDHPGVYYFSVSTDSSYRGLFGWDFVDRMPPDAPGHR